MKWLAFALIVSMTSCISHKYTSSTNNTYKYVQVVKNTMCGNSNFSGNKIVLLSPTKSDLNYLPCTYNWDKIFAVYTDKEKIELLGELLRFSNDTSLCGMPVCRYGYTKASEPKTQTYTLQMDALYMLTLLSVSSHSPWYCPYPVIVDTLTGEEINNNPEKMKEVFAIYQEWFKNSKKNGFKSFSLPLKNSHYEWYGTRKDSGPFVDQHFKIKGLGASAVPVGNCLN